jgi:hypothetical protein
MNITIIQVKIVLSNLTFNFLLANIADTRAATINNDIRILSLTKGSPTIIKLTMNDSFNLIALFWANVSYNPQQMQAITEKKYTTTPVLYGAPNVFTNSNSTHPATLINPGTNPYRIKNINANDTNNASIEPFVDGAFHFL